MMPPEKSLRAAVAVLLAASVAACAKTPPPGMARGKELYTTCVPCHGADGSGSQELGAPNIAGLPKWYVQAELEKFQTRQRGVNAFDTIGIRMRSMSRTLNLPGDVESVAEYVSSMPRHAVPSTVKANPMAGKTTFQTCVACHGPDAMGKQTVGAPPLADQADWYLLRQLHQFKKGWRGTDPRDITGGTMRPMTFSLDENSMANVVAYIQTLK
jgi:cytochrome c553